MSAETIGSAAADADAAPLDLLLTTRRWAC